MNKLYDFFLKEPLKKHDLLCFHSLVLVLVFLSLASFSDLRAQCILDITTSVGECRFNEQTKQSEVLVAVSADWSNEPTGALIQVTFKGITKTIDPATAGCPGYVQFIVPLTMPIATPEIVTAQFASGTCSMATKNVTLPAACPTPLCDLNDLNAMGGYVFNDFDADGVRDPSEYGIKGVRVQLFDCDNNEVCSTVSGENGHWACFNLTRGVLFRVEFSNFPEGYYPGGSGRNASRTEVQFAYSSNCDIDFGLLRPDLFVEDNPWIVTPCYVNGLPEPGSESGNADVLVALEHNVPDNSGDVNHYLAIGSEIGSVWGVAFDKKTNRLFSASMLKRHVGWGPGGLGGIYATDLSTLPGLPSTGSTSLFVNLDELGINTGDELSIPRDLGPTLLSPSYDEAAFDLIGKMGLGDLEISDDGSTLYAVNLFLRTLVIIDIANKTATQINIPNNSCSNSADWRPWALKYHKGKLYVGGICSGQSTYGNPLTPKGDRKQLSTTIYEFNPLLLSFTETFSFPLDYTKGSSTAFLGVNNPQTSKQWNVWTNNFADLIANVDIIPELGYPQPILGDIEFDVYGNMMLGFIDRAGHQVGWNNFGTSSAAFGTTLYKGNSGGDLLRVYNNNGTWLLEQNAQAGYDKTEGENTGEGPCGGEFYFDDKYIDPGETALGGIAVHPSNNQMIAAIIDPFSIYSAGVGWFNNSTGALNKRARIYQGSTGSDGTFGKSAGLGDVELISREATVEVGNYVWEDRNFNGIQDPCELPLAAVNIALYRENGTLVASTTSSSTGFYKFANLEPNTAYILAFGANGQSQNGILTLNGKKYRATTLNVSNNSKDHIDSDITLAGSSVPAALQGLQVVTFTTGERGANNYSFDAGLLLNNFICPTITKLTVPTNLCANTPFSLEASELKNMAAAANLVQNFGIQFVYFNSPTTNPYAGGTALGSVAFGNLGSGGTTAILNNVNLPVGTYHIYAILSPTPTDPNCRPAANGVLTIVENPTSLLTFDDNSIAKTICVGGTASLSYSATLPAGFGCSWTLKDNNGTTIATSTSSVANTTIAIPNVSSLSAGNYTYTLSANCTSGGCSVADKTINLTVLPDPTSTLSFNGGGTAQTICVGGTASIDYSVTLPDGGGCTWTLTGQNINLSGSSSIATTTIAIPNANQLQPGTYNYIIAVNCSTGGCNLENKQITLTVLPDPTSTLSFNGGGAAQTICVGGSASIDYSVTLPDGGGCGWTLTGQNVNLSGSSSVATTTIAIPNANQLAPGTYNYTIAVNCSTGGCNLENKQITLTVLPDPTSTLSFNGGGSTQTICVGGTASIDYSVTLPDGGGCTWTLMGQNVNLSGSSSVAATSISIPNANQLAPGTYNYTIAVNCSTGGCNLESKQITLTVLPDPTSTLSFNGGDTAQTICVGGTASIDYSVTLPDGGGCSWTLTGQNVNLSGSSSAAVTTIAIPDANQLLPGTYNYTITINCSTGGCNLESKQITLTVLANPASTLRFEGGDSTKTICAGGSASISYSTDLPEGCTWTLTGQNVNLNGSSSAAATTIAIPNADDLLPGTYNYTLSVNCTTGDCNLESKQITLTVLANPASTLSFEGGDSTKTICAGGSASISYSTDLPGGCTWTLTGQNVNLTGSSSVTATTIAIPNADDLLPGTYNYILSVNCTTGDCNLESKQITLTVLANPASTLSFEGGDSTKTICAGGSASIDYSVSLPSGCNWALTGQNVNISGTNSVNATTIAIPNADQLTPGNYIYMLFVDCGSGECTVESKQITLTVLENPISTLIFNGGGTTKTICAGGSASIDYSVTLPTNCTWTLTGQNVNLTGTSSVATTTIAIPNADQLAPGVYKYTLTANCPSSDCNTESKEIILTVLAYPASSLSFSDNTLTKTICAGSAASIQYSITLPSGSNCSWKLTGQNVNLSGSSSVAATTLAIPNVTQLPSGTYKYTLTINCPTSDCNIESKEISLTILPNPSATLAFNGGGTTKTICTGETAAIDYSVNLLGSTDCTWTLTGQNVNLSGSSSVSIKTINIPNAEQLAPGTYDYILTASCANGDCGTVNKKITLTVLPDPTTSLSFIGGGTSKTVCAGNVVGIAYSVSLPSGSTCTWTLQGQNLSLSGRNSVSSGAINIPSSDQLVPGTYIYTLSVKCTSGGCSVPDKQITLTVLPAPSLSLNQNGNCSNGSQCATTNATINYKVSLPTGYGCTWTLTGKNVNLSGTSSVDISNYRIPNLDQVTPGLYTYTLSVKCTSGNCNVESKTISIHVGNNAVHNYVIGFPADKKGSCGAVLDTCIYIQENGCDLLAIAVKDLKYKASGDECYKIERTFKVINWCEYDGISDPYVISRDVDGDGVPGDEDIWVIRRPTRTYLDRSGTASNNWVQDLCGNNVELPDEKDGTPAQNTEGRSTPLTDQFPDAPWNQLNPRGAWDWADIKPFSQGGTNDDNNATDDKLYAPGQRALSTGRNSSNFTTGYWEYTQWIKVYDEVDPIVTAQEQLFCSYSTDLAKGCPASAEVEFTVDEPCTPDDLTIKVFLDAFSNGTIDASSLLPANTLKANFGASITGTYPYFVISGGKYPLGEHVFEVHVLDGCGNSTVAKIPFSVIDCKAPSPICINGIAVDLMPVIPFADVDGDGDLEKGAMTVWASDFANVDKISDCSEPIQLAIYRSDDPALANPNFVPNTAHTSLIVTCDDLSNINPNATGSPVLVRVYAIETPKSAKDNINNFDYCETYVLVQDTPADGLVINCSPASPGLIAGTIATEKAKLVKDVTVQMSGQRSASIRTTNEGHYNFSNLQLGYDYTITPTLDANPHNGVSTFDLVLMNKHILGEQLLDSPYKMIAADVNRSKSITTLDLIQLRKLILGVNPHFTNNTSWRFVAKNYTFPNPNNPWLEDFPEIINFNNLSGTYSNVDFVAIKIGDVTANAVANSSEETEIRDFKGTFSINIENTALKTGNVYTVDFRAADLNGIQGYQGTLALDISTIEVIDLVPGIAKADHFGWNYLDQGLITFSWNGKAPAQDAVLFSLVLRAKAEGTLANSLTISSRYTTAEAYDINNNLLNVALQYSNGLVTGTGFALEQNMPNPFSSKTMIRFHLPQVAEAILTISDITGKVVKQVQGTYAKGYNIVELSSSELPTGVLTYTLQSGAFHATKKMIVIK